MKSALSIKKDNAILILILSLMGLVFTNFNAFLALVFGIKSLVTTALLFLSLFIIYHLYFKEGYRFRFWLFQLVILFFIAFIFIGTAAFLWDTSELHENTSLVRIYRNYFSSILLISAFYLGAKFILNNKGVYFLLNTLTIFFLITSLFIVIGPFIGLTSIYENISYSISSGERDSGFFGNPNEAGAFANYTLVIFLTAVLSFKNRKWLWILLLILPIYAALVSFSKAAILIIIALISFYLFYNIFYFFKIGKKNRFYITAFFGLVTFLVINFIANFDSFYNLLEKNQKYRVNALFALAEGKFDKSSTSERNIVFEHAFNKILKRPVFGNGIGSFHRFNDGPLQLGTHNTFLLIQGESGLIPTFLFLTILFAMIFSALKLKNKGMKFFVLGVVFVFMFSRVTFSHTALKDRISNGLIGISLALLAYKVPLKREIKTIC